MTPEEKKIDEQIKQIMDGYNSLSEREQKSLDISSNSMNILKALNRKKLTD